MSSFVHFDIPANDVHRAKEFYANVFNWKFNQAESGTNYWMINTETEEEECALSGGLYQKEETQMPILDYIGVPSVDDYLTKIIQAGGKVLTPKSIAPGWGYWAVCQDTENNTFGLWQDDQNAK